MFATCSTTLFLVPRHPDFGKNNGKIGLLGGFRVFKNMPILPLVSKIMVKSANFTIINGKIRDFFLRKHPNETVYAQLTIHNSQHTLSLSSSSFFFSIQLYLERVHSIQLYVYRKLRSKKVVAHSLLKVKESCQE